MPTAQWIAPMLFSLALTSFLRAETLEDGTYFSEQGPGNQTRIELSIRDGRLIMFYLDGPIGESAPSSPSAKMSCFYTNLDECAIRLETAEDVHVYFLKGGKLANGSSTTFPPDVSLRYLNLSTRLFYHMVADGRVVEQLPLLKKLSP